jgi:hypothetical protein
MWLLGAGIPSRQRVKAYPASQPPNIGVGALGLLSLCILLEWRLSMKSSTSVVAFIAALLFVSMTTVIPAEARRGFSGHVGGHHVSRNVGHYAHRNVGHYAHRNVGHYAHRNVGHYARQNVGHYARKDVGYYARRYDHGYRYGRYYRGPGRWVNGVWVATGVASGVAAVTNNCNYYYRQWKATGSRYWRDRYANCSIY